MRDAGLSKAEPEHGDDVRRKQSKASFHGAGPNDHAETSDRGIQCNNVLL